MVLKDKNGSMLLTLDVHDLDSAFNLAPHTHHALEISCVLEGRGRYYIEGRAYDLCRATLLF